MLEITKATRISRSRVYALVTIARERRQKEGVGITIEPHHVANALRSRRPLISPEAIMCVLKVITQNSTTQGFSCKIISKEVKRKGFEVSLRSIWKVLTLASYNQCKLIVKPRLKTEDKESRLAWYEERKDQTLKEQKNVIFTDETSI